MRPRAHTIVLAVALASGAGQAVETREWTAGPEEMLRGSADGIAVTNLGDLLLAPRTQRLDGALEGSGALEVWSACAGNRGEIFLGTGPDGVVFRTDGNGRGDQSKHEYPTNKVLAKHRGSHLLFNQLRPDSAA